jgi:tetratricopeptide (TPR) repeat protein
LQTAREEAEKACDQLPEVAPWAEGEGHRIRGEIELVFGELDAAEIAFRRAHELGWDPQPGYALLLVARGQADAALRGLEQAAASTDWANQQRRALLLGHLAIVAVAAGERERAEQALQTMSTLSAVQDTPALRALSAVASATLAACRGEHGEAIQQLRAARSLWLDLGAPLEVARVNLKLGEVLANMGDLEGAELELTSARRIFERSGAGALTRLVEELSAKLKRPT